MNSFEGGLNMSFIYDMVWCAQQEKSVLKLVHAKGPGASVALLTVYLDSAESLPVCLHHFFLSQQLCRRIEAWFFIHPTWRCSRVVACQTTQTQKSSWVWEHKRKWVPFAYARAIQSGRSASCSLSRALSLKTLSSRFASWQSASVGFFDRILKPNEGNVHRSKMPRQLSNWEMLQSSFLFSSKKSISSSFSRNSILVMPCLILLWHSLFDYRFVCR